MSSTDVVSGEKRTLLQKQVQLVLEEAVTIALTTWVPAFAAGILKTLLNLFLPYLIKPIAEILATFGNNLRIDFQEQRRLGEYQKNAAALKALESMHVPGAPLTPQEKEANDAFDKSADDMFGWDHD